MFNEFTVLALPFIFREAYRQFTYPPNVDAEWMDENPDESVAVMRVWYDTSYLEDGDYESIPHVLDFMTPNFVEADDIEIVTDTVTFKEYEYTYLGLYGFRQECKVTYELIVPATLRSDPVYSAVGMCVFNDELDTYRDAFITVQETVAEREDLRP